MVTFILTGDRLETKPRVYETRPVRRTQIYSEEREKERKKMYISRAGTICLYYDLISGHLGADVICIVNFFFFLLF